jgi:hypothetical protein
MNSVSKRLSARLGPKLAALGLGAFVIALTVAACGGGGGGGETQPLSVAAFTRQANQICARAEEKVEQEARQIAEQMGGSSEEELDSYVSDVLGPWVGGAMSEQSELGLPKKEAKQAEAMISAYEETLAKAEADPKLILEKDLFAAANRQAMELGLPECVV